MIIFKGVFSIIIMNDFIFYTTGNSIIKCTRRKIWKWLH